MYPKLIISFAAGLMLAASVCGAVYYAEPNNTKETKSTTQLPSEEEMREILSSAGYVIHTDEEWKNFEKTEPDETNEDAGKAKSKEEPVVYRTTLTVLEGMTSIDVGKALQQAKIIDDAMEFYKDVERRGLASKLRPGTYEINSEMSVDKIMSTVFK